MQHLHSTYVHIDVYIDVHIDVYKQILDTGIRAHLCLATRDLEIG
jgi:hypothetical protein